MLAHGVVQGCEAAEVVDTLDVALGAHARVEAVEAADEADDAAGGLAAEDGSGGGRFADGVCDEDEVVDAGCCFCRDGELQGAVGGHGQSGVEFGEVV